MKLLFLLIGLTFVALELTFTAISPPGNCLTNSFELILGSIGGLMIGYALAMKK